MNLNVIRTLTMRAKVEGAEESKAALKGVQTAYEGASKGQLSVADAVSRADRQLSAAARSQQEFARAGQVIVAANDNLARSWRAAELAGRSFRENAGSGGMLGLGEHQSKLSKELERLGLQNAVVTGMLHKTKEGFTILQNPANAAAGAVGHVTSNLNVMTAAADPAAQSVSNFSKHLTLLGAAGVVTGVIIAIRKAMDELFEVANRAQDTRLGSTELLALQAAAVSARVPIESLNAAINAFTEVSKKAPDDAKEFYKSLANINPALSEAFKSAPTQAERLRIIADGFAQSTNEVQKYQVALQTFGTDNDRTISIFDKGRAALDAYVERAHQFGIVVDDAFIKKAQEAQAQLNTLVTLIQQRLTIAVVEGTLAVSQYASSWANVSGVVPGAISSFDSLRKVIRDLAYDFALLSQAWAEIMTPGRSASEGMAAAWGHLKKMFSDDASRVFAVAGEQAWQDFIRAFEERAGADIGRVVNKLDQALRDRLAPTGRGAFQPRPSLKDDPSNSGFDQYDNAIQRSKDLIAQLELEIQALNRTDEAALRLKMTRDLERAALRAELDMTPKMRAEIDELAGRYAKLTVELQRALAIRDAMASVGGGFAKDLFNGVKPLDAAANALTKMRDMLIDMAAKKLATAALGFVMDTTLEGAGQTVGATSAATILTAASATMVAEWIAGATTAAGILTGSGAATGGTVAAGGAAAGTGMAVGGQAAALAMYGPIAALIAVVAGAAFFLNKASSEAKEKAEREERLLETRRAADDFMDRRRGTSGSQSSQMTRDLREMQLIANKFWADKDSGNARKVESDMQIVVKEVWAEFQSGWSGMLDELGRGSSVFSEARANVSKLADEMKTFVKDALYFVGPAGAEQVRRLAQQRLLMTLGGAPELSEVATEMQRIAGTAAALQKALTDVGMAADAAATAIASGVTAALAKLRATFIDGINREINDATGKGYLNQFADLTKRRGTLTADATALGADPALITRWFQVQAQKLVAEAGLTADGFNELIALFPELTGVVTNTVAALRSAQDLVAARLSIEDRLFALGNDPNSLEGQVAAMRRTQGRELVEEQRAGGELLIDLSRLHFLEELKLREDFNKRIQDETERAEKERLDALTSAARDVLDWLSGLDTGPGSSLSPLGRMNASRQAFEATDVLARGGNIDASNRWTQDAEALRAATQSMFGSAGPYQALLAELRQRGLALPAVATSTDPIVVELRNVLAAVQATTTAVGGTTGAVNVAKTVIDTHGGNTVSRIIEGNAIERQIEAYTLQTKQSVDASNELSKSANTLSASANNLLDAIKGFSLAIRNFADSQVTLLDQIKQLNSTSASQLTLLNTNLQPTNIAVNNLRSTNTGDPVNPFTAGGAVNNNAIFALNKIVWNTAVIATNTAFANRGNNVTSISPALFAQGGLAPPFTNFMYGEHHPQGPFIGRTGAQPLAITPNMPVAGNDNGNARLIARIDQLERTLEKALDRVARLTAASADHIREPLDDIRDAVEETGREAKMPKSRAA